jgi:hypothetical protein
MGACLVVLVSAVSALQIRGVIVGRIAIPDRDPKTWRACGRKRKQSELACGRILENVRSPAAIAREKRRHVDPFVWTKSAVHQKTLKPCFAVQ